MNIDGAVAQLATRQYGAFNSKQLRALGGTKDHARARVGRGQWVRATSRVFVIAGTPGSPEQALMVRVLHEGDDALAASRGAGWLWLLPGFSPTGEVARSRSHGVRATEAHRPSLLPEHHRTIVRGIPCTTLPRTMFDLAADLPLGRLARLVDTVITKSPAMSPALHNMLDELAQRGRPGITNMRLILAERPVGERVPASGNERRFEEIMANAGIRGLERQVDVGGHSWLGRVDYRRLDLKLIVEVDSKLHHTSVTDVANDQARDEAMLAAGWRGVVRIWDEDLWYAPWRSIERMRGAIALLESDPTPVLGPEWRALPAIRDQEGGMRDEGQEQRPA